MSLSVNALKSIARQILTNLDGLELSIDEITNALVGIDSVHHETHEGNKFTTSLSTADLDSNPLRINFRTPAGSKLSHFFISASVSGQATLELTEAYTGGAAGGSTLAPYNRNRGSLNTSSLISIHGTPAAGILTQGAADATGGIILHLEQLGVGAPKQAGESRDENEWVLKPDTLYQVSLTSTTNSVVATLSFNWYEHVSL